MKKRNANQSDWHSNLENDFFACQAQLGTGSIIINVKLFWNQINKTPIAYKHRCINIDIYKTQGRIQTSSYGGGGVLLTNFTKTRDKKVEIGE